MYSVIILNYSYLASIHCTRRLYSRIDRKRNAFAEYVSQYFWTTPCISIILEFYCWRDAKYDWFCDQGPVVIGDTCMLHSICLKHSSSTKISALTPKVWFPAGLVDGFFETDSEVPGEQRNIPQEWDWFAGYVQNKNDRNSQTLMCLFRSIFSCPTARKPWEVRPGRWNWNYFFRSTCGERRSNCMLLPFVLAQRTKDNLRFWQWTLWHGCSLAFRSTLDLRGSNHAHK